MEPRVKRIRLQDGVEDMDVVGEQVECLAELEASMRSTLMSTLPILKGKVEMFSRLKERRWKGKVEKLEDQLAAKEKQLNQLEETNNAQHRELTEKVKVFKRLFDSTKDQVSDKEEELRLLKRSNYKTQMDLNRAKKTEMDDKGEIKTLKEKVHKLKNQVLEKE